MVNDAVRGDEAKATAGEAGLPSFDPRPWPLVVLMLAGLVGVFFALQGRLGEGDGVKDAPAAATSRANPATGTVTTTRGTEGRAPGRVAAAPLGEEKERFEQGVTVRFEQKGKADARAGRVLALRVPEGAAATPFLTAGEFVATWSGFVNLRLRGEYTFSVLGRGRVAVKIAGKTVLEAQGEDFGGKASEAIKMEKGRNAIEVVYASPAKGDAWVRVLWQSREFPAEPVQPAVLSHDVSKKALREGMRVREGRELVAELRCGKCHALGVDAAVGMPELALDAPDLSGAGARLKPEWMAAWIADPKSMRADASMPRVFHGPSATAEAGDLAAYLASLGKVKNEEAGQVAEDVVKEGGQLFAGLGCVGCHTKPDVDEVDKEGGRVPLKWVNAKFQPGALRAWLMEPRNHYAGTRMPDFRLTELEAGRLVAYLNKSAKGEVAAREGGDVEEGKKLFVSAGCVNCHAVKEVAPTPRPTMAELVASGDWEKGCLAKEEGARGAAPDFGLSDRQREALRAVAAVGVESVGKDVVTEFAGRAVRSFQCGACHGRDEVEDWWSTVSEEVAEMMPPETNIESDQTEEGDAKGERLFVPRGLGKLHAGDRLMVAGDQTRPTLTWAGEKLRAGWMGRFIAGEVAYKPRYWMRARMPAFHGPVAKGIAGGLALEHGFPVGASPKLPEAKADLAEIGRKLVGRDGGLACITCHSVVDVKAVSPFEAPAPNLLHVPERLTEDYYLRWMRKPMRFVPGTKMPQFSEEGRSALTEILGGDADRQFDAIWQYTLQGERMGPPE